MSSLLHFSILGVIQGLTEFLPVSSSGHLAIFSKVFGLSEISVELTLLLHIASLCAVFLYLRKELLQVVKSPRLILVIAVATIPTGVIGILLSGVVKNIFQLNPNFVFFLLFITGVIIFFAGRVPAAGGESFEGVTFPKAFIIGIAQGIAVLPGISRSGTTIAAGIFSGINSKTAAKFSFLLSIPAIMGASVVGLKDFQTSILSTYPVSHILIGMFFAFISALAGLWILVKIVEVKKLGFFAYYLWAAAIFGMIVRV